ncbi:hypothetical protein CPB86DRAFT_174535 [Serendipita vermifera]|nr:hypothetical protein CPB86DRAFT_174535 [Serendipita vermifera]
MERELDSCRQKAIESAEGKLKGKHVTPGELIHQPRKRDRHQSHYARFYRRLYGQAIEEIEMCLLFQAIDASWACHRMAQHGQHERATARLRNDLPLAPLGPRLGHGRGRHEHKL